MHGKVNYQMDFITRFKESVFISPNKIAARYGNKSMTYEQLDRMSDSICVMLTQNNVSRGSFVGLLMDRSLDFLISVIGILKCGCGFLPIDTSYPIERIKYVIKDSNLNCVICNNTDLIQVYPQCIKYVASELTYLIESKKPENAYMIYTSGSTGRPKGVMISYESLNNVLSSFYEIIDMTVDDVLYAITTFSFDISILELLLPIYSGAEVVISGKRAQIDPVYLQKELIRYNVTLMQATPITWTMLLESGWTNEKNIKILCGGESLSLGLAERLLAHSTNVWNVYGPTETTIWSSAYRVLPDKEISIGKPIHNTYFMILDEEKNSASEGELLIGGVGVSKGYWNREELNREKYTTINGVRYYFTGDIVREIDENYYFVCRKDYQVKVNGHRIELGEIESVISGIPNVKDVVVIYEKNKIVAFVIERAPIDNNAYMEHISKFLPSYMVPNEFIRLRVFPYTNNNKVDRKELRKYVVDTTIIEDADIYSQGLSSYDVMCLASQYSKRGYLLRVEDLLGGKTIKESIRVLNENENAHDAKNDVWEMQKQMALCRLLYPTSDIYYERCILHMHQYNQDYLFKQLTELFSLLDISKLFPKFKRGMICWELKERKIVEICSNIDYCQNAKEILKVYISENSDVIICFHHSLLDGESIQLLAELIVAYLSRSHNSIESYNGFLQANRIINENCKETSSEIVIPEIFSYEEGVDEKVHMISSKIPLDIIASKKGDYQGKIVPFLHFCLANAIRSISNEKVVYGCVVSNRMYTNSDGVLGNFINLVSMIFPQTILNSFDAFLEEYKHNLGNCKFVYNPKNKYQMVVIVNDYRKKMEYSKLIKEGEVELAPRYENNIFPINLCFDIMDELTITLSYKGIKDEELLNVFFDRMTKRIKEF